MSIEDFKRCLESSHYVDNLGSQDDPLRFFLLSCAAVNEQQETIDLVPSYALKIKSLIQCFKCGYEGRTSVNETCLSLAIPKKQKNPCRLIDLVEKTFEPGTFQRPCACGSSLSSVRRVLGSCPQVLSLHLKRYDNSYSRKRSNLVIPTPEIDLSTVLDPEIKTVNTIYQLRCVITHKGTNLDSGHFTATIFEQGVPLEVDDMKILNLKNRYDMFTGGSIFLYENKKCLSELLSTWHR